MYEAVGVEAVGRDALPALVETLDRYGYAGVVRLTVAADEDAVDTEASAEPLDENGIDVVSGLAVDAADAGATRRAIDAGRDRHPIVAVRGGTVERNRRAVDDDRVDVLLDATADEGDVDHVIVKRAARKGVRIAFDLGPVLRRRGGRRVRWIQSLRKLHDLVDHYDAPHVVTASPTSRFEVRAPRELCAVGERIGLTTEWVESGLEAWGSLAERNRRILSGRIVEGGVERRSNGDS